MLGLLAGVEVECWGEVLTDDRDPRALGADSLSNNSGELWALAEAFLWLRDESGDDKTVSVTLVYDFGGCTGPSDRTMGATITP